MGRRLAGHFDTLQQVAAEAGLSSRAVEKLAKARRVLDAMNATIAFFWKMIGVWFSCWNLPEPVQQWMRVRVTEKVPSSGPVTRIPRMIPPRMSR